MGKAASGHKCRARIGRVGVVLSLVRAKVPELVPDNWPTEGTAVLLVLEGDDVRLYAGRGIFCYEVGRVEKIVTEVAEGPTVNRIHAALRLRVDVHASRASKRRVKAVRDDLELGDSILREARLPKGRSGRILRHLQAVHRDLELARLRRRTHRHIRCNRVDLDAGNKRGKLHVVAPVDGQTLHLLRRDVAGHGGGGRINGDGIACNHHIFRVGRQREHRIEVRRLPYQHRDPGPHGAKARSAHRDGEVTSGQRRDQVRSLGIGLRVEGGGPLLPHFDGGTGDHGPLRIRHAAGDARLLCKRRSADHQYEGQKEGGKGTVSHLHQCEHLTERLSILVFRSRQLASTAVKLDREEAQRMEEISGEMRLKPGQPTRGYTAARSG